MPPAGRRIVLAANASWNIANFRGGLVNGLREAGYEPIALTPPDAVADQRLHDLGVATVPVRIDRSGVDPVADLALLLRYRRVLKRLRPLAFFGFTVKPNIYGTLAASSLGIPVVANVSGLGTVFIRTGLLERIVSALYRLAFRRAAIVFFHNAEDRDLFTGRRIVAADKARLLPGSGVNLDRFAPADLPERPPVFLLIARLLRDKGVREYAEAARLLRRRLPGARFQLLGGLDEGNRTAIARSELQSWVDEGIIDYLGETEDVRPFIARATALVLPSYREGLPRSLLEGAAMARPLIATDVPGCRQVVEPGVNGFLCHVRDARSLAEAMKSFADLPPGERSAMGAASRRMVQDAFSEQLVVRAYLDVLDGLPAG